VYSEATLAIRLGFSNFPYTRKSRRHALRLTLFAYRRTYSMRGAVTKARKLRRYDENGFAVKEASRNRSST
jgi:hypothetical protein